MDKDDVPTLVTQLTTGVVAALGVEAEFDDEKKHIKFPVPVGGSDPVGGLMPTIRVSLRRPELAQIHGQSALRVQAGAKRDAALRYTTALNAAQNSFCLEIDMRDGEVRVRSGCLTANVGQATTAITEHVLNAVRATLVFNKDMLALNNATETVDDKFADDMAAATIAAQGLAAKVGREQAAAAARRFGNA